MTRHNLTTQREVRCPNCGAKLANELDGRAHFTCRKKLCGWSGWIDRTVNNLTATVVRVDWEEPR